MRREVNGKVRFELFHFHVFFIFCCLVDNCHFYFFLLLSVRYEGRWSKMWLLCSGMIQIKSIKNAMFWVLNTYLCEKEKVLGSELFKKILELISMNGARIFRGKKYANSWDKYSNHHWLAFIVTDTGDTVVNTVVNWRLSLAIPLYTDLNHKPQQLLPLNIPWNQFRVEFTHVALCALGKMAEQVFRCFQEIFYEPSSCISLHLEKH